MLAKIYTDLFRANRKNGLWALIDTAFRKREFRYIVYYRWYQSGKAKPLARLFLRNIAHKTLIDIGWKAHVGAGFVIVHSGGIAVNNDTYIGENCTIYRGVTIGMEFRGARIGSPTIGNNVWIGSNATIVGNINIGNDVLIAPLAFVNFDVPSHSIVIGNPAQIIPRNNATEGYITNIKPQLTYEGTY